MEFITEYITGLGFWGCFAQIVGFLAALSEIISFQQKTRKGIMISQSVASILWISHMFLLGAPSGAIQNTVKLIMTTVFFFRTTHKWAEKWWWYAVFMSASAAGTVYSWISSDGWYAIFPFLGMVLTTVAYSLTDPFRIRVLSLAAVPCWQAYNIVSGSIAGIITEVFNFVSIIIGIIRIDIVEIRKRKRKEAEKLKENTQNSGERF